MKINLKSLGVVLFHFVIALMLAGMANAETVAVSQFGFHPTSWKQSVSYTNVTSGTFEVRDLNSNAIVFSGNLESPKDYSGNNANCQGNMPCLVGDFSVLQSAGNYYVQTSLGGKSGNFTISNNVYSDSIPTFLEFFDAMLQQKSDYHADMHNAFNPSFPAMADGSFIMEADQAALSLMRLGSAYRKNPSLFQADKYSILAAGKPDMLEHIMIYVNYLKGLQGVSIQERSDGTGFRLKRGMKIENAFVPGPTNLTSLDIYNLGHGFVQTVPVVSLCGNDDGSAAWDKCINDAASFYKCQINEPCISMKYIDKTGTLLSNSNGYGISRGWSYEFGCYFDVDASKEIFSSKYNPCMVFEPESSRKYTTLALLGFLEAVPAAYDYSPAEASSLMQRSFNTYHYIKNNYPDFGSDEDTGFFGAALFLLYDYTKNQTYLNEAYNLRNNVSIFFISDITNGNEFYWEEYVRHKDGLTSAGLQYIHEGVDPKEFFRGKIFNDYKDKGIFSISNTGERIFQFDNNIQFQNSRFILLESIFAAKASELNPGTEEFIPLVAESQLAWLTGMNNIQQGTGINAPTKSMSFIFGIGDFPTQFHSRYLFDTGYAQGSNGNVIGVRSNDFMYKSGSNFINLDGKTSIINSTLGTFGNRQNGETGSFRFANGRPFKNGKAYIPGWINGAFDIFSDTDTIFNYNDKSDVYEYTETTNEMVAMAIELAAYLDGAKNNKDEFSGIDFTFNVTSDTQIAGNTTNSGASGNDTSTPSNNPASNSTLCYANIKDIPANCTGTISADSQSTPCRTITCNSGTNSLKIMACNKPDSGNYQYFEMYKQSSSGNPPQICLSNTCIKDGGYAKSHNYPICLSSTATSSSSNNNTQTNNSTVPNNSTTNNSTANQQQNTSQNTTTQISLACYSDVNLIPSNCTGGIISQDTKSGCRTIVCSNGESSMKIFSCNKPDGASPQYFEMYKQSQVGTIQFTICIGPVCMRDNGYARSANYPICISSTQAISNNAQNNAMPPNQSDPNATVQNGNILVITFPSISDIFLNNVQKGTSNSNGELYMQDLIPGNYNVLARKAGYNDASRAVSLNSGQNLTVALNLTQIESSNQTCISNVKDMPSRCNGGTISQDSFGGCRTIICNNSTSSLKIMACNKPDGTTPQFFEMYKQAQSGALMQICIGTACIKENGYIKSQNFPIC